MFVRIWTFCRFSLRGVGRLSWTRGFRFRCGLWGRTRLRPSRLSWTRFGTGWLRRACFWTGWLCGARLGPCLGSCLRPGLRGRLGFWSRMSRLSGPGVIFRSWPAWCRLRAGSRFGMSCRLIRSTRLRRYRSIFVGCGVIALWSCRTAWFCIVWFRPRIVWFRPACRLICCPHLRTHHRSRFDSLIGRNGPRCRHLSRTTLVYRSQLRTVGGRYLGQLQLGRHRRCMRGAESSYFPGARSNRHSVRAAVVADPIDGRVVDGRGVHDGPVVHIRDVNIADVIYGSVVGKVIAIPVAALVTPSCISESIINSAVKADVAAPVSMEEGETSAAETPVARGPKCSLVGRLSPCSWNPVVAF